MGAPPLLELRGVSKSFPVGPTRAEVLKGVCPNCGGELVRRPVRPAAKLKNTPPSTVRVFKAEGCAPGRAA